jgi:hypothetical protein
MAGAFQEIYDELRAVRKELATLRRRRNQTLVAGTVEAVKGDRVRVKIAAAGQDGKPVLSPWLRMAANTGARGAGVSAFRKYGRGEAVLIMSPSGEVGTMSAVMPWIDTTQDPAPGKAEQDGDVTTIGNAAIRQKDGNITITVGGATLSMIDSEISLKVGGSEIRVQGSRIILDSALVQALGDRLRHNARNVGDTHIHGGVVQGGSTTTDPAN